MYELSASTFPLPSLAQRFSAFKHMLHSGYGFFTIRGLKPSEHSDEENNIIHVGISSYFGDQRALQQNYVAKKAEALRTCAVRFNGSQTMLNCSNSSCSRCAPGAG